MYDERVINKVIMIHKFEASHYLTLEIKKLIKIHFLTKFLISAQFSIA